MQKMNGRIALSKLRTVFGIMNGSRAFGGPVQVNLRLTNRCNLCCIHCYYYSPLLEVPAFCALRMSRKEGSAHPPSSAELKKMLKIDADPRRLRELVEE